MCADTLLNVLTMHVNYKHILNNYKCNSYTVVHFKTFLKVLYKQENR